jgi:hypothetical protein
MTNTRDRYGKPGKGSGNLQVPHAEMSVNGPCVIDVPGEIRAGDKVEVRVYEEPVIRLL